jgi:signal peptidase I
MEPTLHNNQRLVIEKVSYRFHPPRRGDIVVFRLPNQYVPPLTERVAAMIRTVLTRSHTAAWPDPLIKRVIGLPGETVEIREGRVYINGVQLAEPYETQLTLPDLGPRVIAPGHVFVLGDNRGGSNDSRAFGEVPLSDIIGRAWFRYWPVEQIGLLR